MSGRSRDSLRERLIIAGISPRYARRLAAELDDHQRELIDELRREGHCPDEAHRIANERLGSDGAIVEGVLATGRFRSFGRRAPFVVFILAPLLAVPVFAIVMTIFTGTFIYLLWKELGLFTEGQAMHLFLWAFIGMAPAIFACTSVIAVTYARSRRCPLIWPLITATLLTCIAALIRFEFGPATNTVAAAIATGAPYRIMLPALPLAIVMLVWFVHRSFQRPTATPSPTD